MKTIDYVQFNQDGTMEYVTEHRSNRNPTEDFINKMGSGVVRHVPDAFLLNGQPVGVVTSGPETYAYTLMKQLSINCSFKIGGDKMLRPIYMHQTDKDANRKTFPQFIGRWTVPPSMRLMFASKIIKTPESTLGNTACGYKNSCLLIAWDKNKKAFRLPLPNLYDNCFMCMGEYHGRGNCIAESFGKAVEQLEKSDWNSDLLNDERSENSDKMFVFKPGEDGAMDSVPYTGDWTRLCPTAGSASIDILSIAL